MRPSVFRSLPRHEQVEMMAHRKEMLLRNAHSEHVARIVAEKTKDDDKKDKTAGGSRRRR